MKTTTRPALAALVALTGLGLTACGQGVEAGSPTPTGTQGAAGTQAGPAAYRPVTIENCGRTETFTKAPTRSVAMTPGQAALLARLGVGSTVVGVAQVPGGALADELGTQLPAEAAVLSADKPPAREVTLKARPEVVVSPTGYEFTAEKGFASVEQLHAARAGAYVATAGCFTRRSSATVEDLFVDIENLGRIYGRSADAERVAGEGRAILDRVSKALAGVDRLSVAELYIDGQTLSAIGAGVEFDMVKRAGGDNVYKPTDPEFKDFFAGTITPESLLERNPEAIILNVASPEQEQVARQVLKTRFASVRAVADDRIATITFDEALPGTWGNVTAVEKLARALYPASF